MYIQFTTPRPSKVTTMNNESVSSDVSLFHTIDDDIAFERVRHMPRRTQFVSHHRKLSWQHDREVRQHERDQKIAHVQLSRAQQAMTEKLSRLQDAKKQVARHKSESAFQSGTRHHGHQHTSIANVTSPRTRQSQTLSFSTGVTVRHTGIPQMTPYRKVIVAKVPSMDS